jgi:hypothetical protein
MATSEITFLRAESSAEYYEIGRHEGSLGPGFLGGMCFLCYLKGELRVDQCRGLLCVGSISAHRDLIGGLVMQTFR